MTDYTSLTSVKLALGSNQTTDDTLLSALITQASRTIDRYCVGVVGCDNYFARETLTDVLMAGVVSRDGMLLCYPRKAVVESVSALAYRSSSQETWQEIDPARVEIGGYRVSAAGVDAVGMVRVKISFIGGFSLLPDDLVNAATLLAVRFYREVKSGLGDSIGVAELGTLTYTKALPVRVIEMLKPYKRVIA